MGLTPGLPAGKETQGEGEKTGDGAEIDMCPPDVALARRAALSNSEERVKKKAFGSQSSATTDAL